MLIFSCWSHFVNIKPDSLESIEHFLHPDIPSFDKLSILEKKEAAILIAMLIVVKPPVLVAI
jgi:hypothetical protein